MNRRPRPAPRTGWWMEGWFPGALFTVGTDLHRLGKYLESVAAFLEHQGAAFEAGLKAEAAALDLSEEDADRFYEAHEEQFESLRLSFPRTVRYTTLISACSTLESGLTGLCRELEEGGDVPVTATWGGERLRKHRGISKGARFLRLNFGIYAEDHPMWARIGDAYTIRDCAVHAGGEVSLVKDGPQLEAALASFSDVRAGHENDRLVLPDKALARILDDMQQFWRDLERAMVDNADIGPVYWP